ncbi:MAG: hypothetical protein J0H22_05245, partial [Actinobacteria bacterium]|nr:hypothetical protein [Actinomycetota bacterium]
MSAVRQAIADAAAVLAAAGVDSARVDAEYLAAHVAGVDRARVMFTEPDAAFYSRFGALVERRAQRIPLQNLVGTAAFGPVEVQVGPGVFIPRPETEALLEWAMKQPVPSSPVIVDLCTGSGRARWPPIAGTHARSRRTPARRAGRHRAPCRSRSPR